MNSDYKDSSVQFLTINLASPDQIRKWAETVLPSGKIVGQVLNANTLHHKTLKPIKGGLFCERIFGPVKDYQCFCGVQKEKPISRVYPDSYQKTRKFCAKCEVEYTWSDKRRTQCGYIQCSTPVAHIWYFKFYPSWVSILLDMKKNQTESIIYCAETLSIDSAWNPGRTPLFLDNHNEQLNRFLTSYFLKKRSGKSLKNKGISTNLFSPFKNFECDSIHKKSSLNLSHSKNKKKEFIKTSSLVARSPKWLFYIKPSFSKKAYNYLTKVKASLSGKKKNFLNEYSFKNSFSSYNNLYCLSHRYGWTNEGDLSFFLYYIWGESDGMIINYPISYYHTFFKNRISSNDPSLRWYETFFKKDFVEKDSLEKDAQKFVSENTFSSSFSPTVGAGIVYKLLKELEPLEISNMVTSIKLDIQNLTYTIRQYQNFLAGLTLFKKNEPKKTNKLAINSLKSAIESSNNQKKRFFKKLMKRYRELKKIKTLLFRRLKYLSFFNFPGELSSADLSTEAKEKLTAISRPEWMIFTVLPVLPPDLRPIILVQNQITSSDLNRLYQKVIYRNERVQKFLKDPATANSAEMRFAQRLFQESVDNLIENGKGNPETDSRGRPLKSISELLKGKKGRFRQNLLGKRVDYSGRTVIVVGPKLKLHQCGLPKEMAIELFLPFLINEIILNGFAKTVVGAKKWIENSTSLNVSNGFSPSSFYPRFLVYKKSRGSHCRMLRAGLASRQLLRAKNETYPPLMGNTFGALDTSKKSFLKAKFKISNAKHSVNLLSLNQGGNYSNLQKSAKQKMNIEYNSKKNFNSVILFEKREKLLNTLLRKILLGHPILLNRAPTLHRVGIQAFQPVLVHGRAILLHPLVCPAFNADFDGDQMAVHIPITMEARAEAWKIMGSRNNFLSTATGEPLILPSQDMVLGCYYLTTSSNNNSKANYSANSKKNISSYLDIKQMHSFSLDTQTSIHSPIWMEWRGAKLQTEQYNVPLKTIEIQVSWNGSYHSINKNSATKYDYKRKKSASFIRTTPGRVFFNKILQEVFYGIEAR